MPNPIVIIPIAILVAILIFIVRIVRRYTE